MQRYELVKILQFNVFLSAVFAAKQIKQVGKAREVMTLFVKIL